MDATCKQNSNETSAAFETTVPQSTKENVPQNTKENVDQGMERDSQLVGASHLVYKLSWLQVPPYTRFEFGGNFNSLTYFD